MNESNEWDRLPRETDRQFQAFRCYLELGLDRSYEAAWRAYKARRGLSADKMPSSFRKWTKANNWQGRAEAFDADALEVADDRRAEVMAELNGSILDSAPQVLDALIRDALAGDGKSQRYLLDRVLKPPGQTPGAGAHFNGPTQINSNVDLSGLPFDQLIGLIKADNE